MPEFDPQEDFEEDMASPSSAPSPQPSQEDTANPDTWLDFGGPMAQPDDRPVAIPFDDIQRPITQTDQVSDVLAERERLAQDAAAKWKSGLAPRKSDRARATRRTKSASRSSSRRRFRPPGGRTKRRRPRSNRFPAPLPNRPSSRWPPASARPSIGKSSRSSAPCRLPKRFKPQGPTHRSSGRVNMLMRGVGLISSW